LLAAICADPEAYAKTIDIEHVKNVVYLLRNVGNLWSREPTSKKREAFFTPLRPLPYLGNYF